jgi:predicted dehydrogenase
MSAAPLRFALLGVAHYHATFWAEAIGQMPGEAVLVGVWDDDAERGGAAAARFGTVFEPELTDLLARSDAAGITSETVKHRALIEACAEAGVPVLCEKPLAANRDDCAAIAAVERRSQIVIRQNLPKRTDPINEELRQLLQSGDLGDITLARIRHGHRHGLDPSFLAQWYADPDLSGGGALIDEGVHAADFLRWLFGDPCAVSAATRTHLPGLRVEDTACATFHWASGLLAQVTVGWTFVAGEQSVETFGTDGTAVIDGVDIASRTRATAPYLRWYRQDGDRVTVHSSGTIPRFVSGGFHQEGPKRFVRFLRGGPDGLATVADGIAALDMVFAAYASAASGHLEPIGA